MATTTLETNLRAEQRQRSELAQAVLSLEGRLHKATDDGLRGASSLLNERARAEAAEGKASQLAHEKKRLSKEVARLKEQLARSSNEKRTERDSECEEADRALAATASDQPIPTTAS